jgi:hypothetical protein
MVTETNESRTIMDDEICHEMRSDDELYELARHTVKEEGRASTALLQRTIHVGYARAMRLMDKLAENGVIGRTSSPTSWVAQKNVTYLRYEDVMIPNIYLDIDGVLLVNDRQAALYAKEFLTYLLGNYPDTTYWLTTHCRGDAEQPIRNVGHLFDSEALELMKRIKPTSWKVAKTEAIDFSWPFLWFDDDLLMEEQRTLEDNGVLENHIMVDLAKDPAQLQRFLEDFPLPVS